MKPIAEQLSKSHVHIGGIGRVGTAVAVSLHAAGIGHISCNDPQEFEMEQLACYPFARRSDLGRHKVHVLERFFDGRPDLLFEPVVAANDSPEVLPYLKAADVIVSCANRLDARLDLERAAVSGEKPSVQATVQDGRHSLGGLISVWMPGTESSCFGCLFPTGNLRVRRGELLLPTVTATIGSLTAHVVRQILAHAYKPMTLSHNVFTLDLAGYGIERLSIKRRPSCLICSKPLRSLPR